MRKGYFIAGSIFGLTSGYLLLTAALYSSGLLLIFSIIFAIAAVTLCSKMQLDAEKESIPCAPTSVVAKPEDYETIGTARDTNRDEIVLTEEDFYPQNKNE